MVCEDESVFDDYTKLGLNPCFNGIWSASHRRQYNHGGGSVLNLVLMEYGLRGSNL